MMSPSNELDVWLAGGELIETGDDDWYPGFDADRQLVMIKLGPYQTTFLRPEKFVKRFYHRVFPLEIADWHHAEQIQLFDRFCTIDVNLEVRFQATIAYAQRNLEILPDLNQHVKQVYAAMLHDVIHREAQRLPDGRWVQTGLTETEKTIAQSISEWLMIQLIQAQVICRMQVSFAEFPDITLGRNNIYLNVLKKTFEETEQRNAELFRQEQLLEQQRLAHKQQQLEQLQQALAVERQIQAQQAENERLLLQDKEDQLRMRLAIEKRLHQEQLNHDMQLQEMALDAELQTQEKIKARRRLHDSQVLADQLAHQARMDESKLIADIQRHENQRNRWREIRQRQQADNANFPLG